METHGLDEARAARRRAKEVFSKAAPVVGVGLTRIDGGFGLKVNLGAPPAPGVTLPEQIDGVPVRVEVVGSIRPS